MDTPIPCERCKTEPKARYVSLPKPVYLCWGCFDAWRRWYFGRNYIHCIPIEQLKAMHQQAR